MGTAWSRILGKHLMIAHEGAIAETLTPLGQFGMSVRGGIDFVVHSARVHTERHLQPGNEMRATLLMDLQNVFNEAS